MTSLEMTVRIATPADDPAISALLIESFVSTYAKKMPEVVVSERRILDLKDIASKREAHFLVVGVLNEKVIATGTMIYPGGVGSEAWVDGACDIRYLAVSPAFHGKGLADPIMDVLEARAKEIQASALCLHVRRGAQGVARFYERRGYIRAPEGDLNKLPEIYLEGFFKLTHNSVVD